MLLSVVDRLDRCLPPIYKYCGYIAALFMLMIAGLVLAGIGSRLSGIYLPGLNVYAGFCMAAGSSFAMAYTFTNGGHVRVSLVLNAFGGRFGRALEIWCYGFSAALSGALTYYLVKMAWVSHLFDEKSEGIDATPLWIPQSALGLGFAVLSVACFHHGLKYALTGKEADTELSDGAQGI